MTNYHKNGGLSVTSRKKGVFQFSKNPHLASKSVQTLLKLRSSNEKAGSLGDKLKIGGLWEINLRGSLGESALKSGGLFDNTWCISEY